VSQNIIALLVIIVVVIKTAEALAAPGGKEAANLEVAKQYVTEFGKLAKQNNTMIVPANLAEVNTMVAAAMATLQHVQQGQNSPAASGSKDPV